jgi:DNA-binding SARP family transcriptional activator/Tfp pilus assembly protein PilF
MQYGGDAVGMMMLSLSFLGAMRLHADGVARPLPRSRKTRALLAYLALEPRRHRREALCELLWDIPDDPRAALRWSLTKLRPLLDQPDRLLAGRDDVGLAREGLLVDVLEVRSAIAAGPALLPTERLETLFEAAGQPFLAAEDLPQQPVFDAWTGALRREMAAAARTLGDTLLARPLPPASQLAVLARMIAADPHDAALHGKRIALLAASGDRDQAAQATSAATRLVAEVSATAAADVRAAARQTVPAAAAEPSGVLARVVVQPLAGTGASSIAGPLAQMVSAGIADGLARFGNLAVVAPDAPGLADAYVVSGSLVQAGARVRVRCRLTDPAGQIIWSDEINREGDDLIALEEDVTGAIISALESRIRFARAGQAREQPPTSANSLFLRALAHMAGDGDFHAAERLLEQALVLDPDHGLAGAYLPWVAIQTGRISGPETAARYIAMARHAVHCAPADVMVQAVGGLMYLLLSHDFDGALEVIERALALQPLAAFPWLARGWVRVHAGNSAEAIADFDRAEALSLTDPTDNSINAGRALACYQEGDLAAAQAYVQRALARNRGSLEAMRVGIAAAVEQGDLPAAQALAVQLRARNPLEHARRARIMPFRRPGVADRFYAAYRAAGIPD